MNTQAINITLFYCSNSFSPEEIHYYGSKIEDVQLNAISIPCSGKVNLLYLLKAIETGSDGVIIMTCKIGECKYLQGNLRAQKRIEAANELLGEAGFGTESIRCVHLNEGQKMEALVKEIIKFCNHLKMKPLSIKEEVYNIK